jgi:hypothetical protein
MNFIITNPKKFYIFWGTVAIIIIAVIVGGIFAWKKYKAGKENPENHPQIYEALVQVVDEKNSDPEEDKKSSMKKGDVLVIFPEGHTWSETERISYLILKINLKKEDADKLMQPVTKKIKTEKPALPADGDENGKPTDTDEEIVSPRKYRLKIEKLDFDLEKIWAGEGQPYPDKIFDKSLIQKK